jgi:hypothetical protein
LKVIRASVILQSNDKQAAVNRYEQLFSTPPMREFRIPGRELIVSAFAGFSVLSGSNESLASLRDLRATVFVESLKETMERLIGNGWRKEGTLGSAGSILARDIDGNLLEFVEESVEIQREPGSPLYTPQ